MDLYTLTPTFMAKDNINEFVSAIWTERYAAAGDFELVLPISSDNLVRTAPGTYLALRGTKEVMECRTQALESGLLKVVGNSLIGFLNERQAWFDNPTSSTPDLNFVADLTDTTRTAGELISHVVDISVIDPVPFEPSTSNLIWEDEVIPHLELGSIDHTPKEDEDEPLTVTMGPLYDSIAQVAQKEKVGISLYLDSADAIDGYVLKFKTYRGVDRTTGVGKIRLTPQQGSMANVKEVRSNAYLKNVCYVYYKGKIHVFYADPELPIPTGMDRRVLVTNPDKEPVGHKEMPIFVGPGRRGPQVGTYTQTFTFSEGDPEFDAFLAQNAKDALANANYIQAVDGQTTPNVTQKYGVDYGLGDVIELEGLTGTVSKARITEYVRAQDKSGERAYPTIAVETDTDGGIP